jgi:transcription elongation factor GreA
MNDKLTRKDIQKMEEEIEHRKLVIRKEALEAVKEARAQGDLSENFEYYAAKKYKNQNESRIRYLERMIKTAQIIDDESKEDEIGLNKTVEVEFVEDGTVEMYRLVTTVRNNPLEGLVSIDSPIGKSLIGHKKGETVHVQVNKDYGYDVVVKSVINTPDDDSIELRKF